MFTDSDDVDKWKITGLKDQRLLKTVTIDILRGVSIQVWILENLLAPF